jgi:flavin reductase (DIM6/NTAB) family NADH-FMN oxidoreductase RutF
MTVDARNLPGEQLRQAMRRWVTGVTIVTSQQDEVRHGMTVNSFVSISLDPPLVSVTLAVDTRTFAMVRATGLFGVTVLAQDQAHLSDIFAGRVPDGGDRFAEVEPFHLTGLIPLISGGLAALECRVVHEYPIKNSTLFIGEVQAAWHREDGEPLLYFNRAYHRMEI